MQNFESLKNIWEQSPDSDSNLPALSMSKTSASAKTKMQKQQLGGAVILVLTALLIGAMAVFGNFNFTHWYTYGAMVLICLVCLVQAGFMYSIYKSMKNIDATVTPARHLQQWEHYYALRKKQNNWNMPLYYLFLNIAMGIYLVEVFAGRPVIKVSIFIAVYVAWMLFAFFYLSKKAIRKEDKRINAIINELKSIETQLNEPE
ncbi:MAG: hypothetical protein ABIO05_01950 [Ferruginibacter sp.]